jgi:hypothetical protein
MQVAMGILAVQDLLLGVMLALPTLLSSSSFDAIGVAFEALLKYVHRMHCEYRRSACVLELIE